MQTGWNHTGTCNTKTAVDLIIPGSTNTVHVLELGLIIPGSTNALTIIVEVLIQYICTRTGHTGSTNILLELGLIILVELMYEPLK